MGGTTLRARGRDRGQVETLRLDWKPAVGGVYLIYRDVDNQNDITLTIIACVIMGIEWQD